ncbi:MAG TPA: carbohydrate-binding family 9-like protein [Blastocatellia bacterium]|nr:carbohydrate-binding family 9-like protein [Blastocatellia bacterium]
MGIPEIVAFHQPESLLPDTNFSGPFWSPARRLEMKYNWRGEAAPAELKTVVMAAWSDDYLCFGFECSFAELDMNDPAAEGFDLQKECYALWERDVCEAFVRSPLENDYRIYREFEAAPNGQWCDLKIDWIRMLRDWEWRSGILVSPEISRPEKVFRITMAIPFDAFGVRPKSGDTWQANLFRVSRLNTQRQYLTLSPTMTERPNFHVPERFVNLIFR